jgi:Ca2+-binding RTX toxin-like protein
MATLIGSNAAESLVGGDDAHDVIFGLGGTDTLVGGAGRDTLAGGDGDDLILGGQDQDRLSGGNGNDVFRFASAAAMAGDIIGDARPGDRLDLSFAAGFTFIGSAAFSGAGNEVRAVRITLEDGSTAVSLQTADATLTLAGAIYVVPTGGGVFDIVANRVISGTNGAETLESAGGADTLRALGGDDVVRLGVGGGVAFGQDGADTLYGNVGADLLNGGDGDDVAFGGDGADTLYGYDGADSLSGGAGADSMTGNAGADTLHGGAGHDRLSGGSENDVLIGGTGADTLMGDAGDDTLVAGNGASRLDGGSGHDILHSGTGGDVLTGGAGNDRFVFATLDSVGGDRIVDFARGDQVDLSAMAAFLRLVTDRFTGDAGEVLVTDAGIGIDMDGDGIADRSISISSAASGTPLEEVSPGSLVFRYGEPLLLSGTAGNDLLRGGNFADSLSGLGGHDTLLGGLGADRLEGGNGADRLVGGGSADLVLGGAGRDLVIMGAADTVHGGTGADRFVVTEAADATIADFTFGDMIDLSAIEGLVFIGTAAFSGMAGELRQDYDRLLIDTDGDGDGDVQIDLDNPYAYERYDTLRETVAGSLVLEYERPVLNGTSGADRFDIDVVVFEGRGPSYFPRPASHSLSGDAITAASLAAGDSIVLRYSNYSDYGNTSHVPVYRGTAGFSGNEPWQIVVRDHVWIGDTYVLKGLALNRGPDQVTDVLVDLGDFNGDLAVSIAPWGLTDFYVTVTAVGGAHRRIFGDGTDNVLTALTGGDTLMGVAGADTLLGGSGADQLNGGIGNDVLIGGRGNDMLIGWTGADTLTGGEGPDLFVFGPTHASRGAGRDVITDFDAGDGDIIDLGLIDADPVAPGRQSFVFIDDADFSEAGQARYARGLLQLDWTGDGRADLEVRLLGAPALPESHLIL